MPKTHEPAPLPPSSSGEPRPITQSALTAMLDLSPDALILVNEAGTIMMLNEQTETFFGYSRQELLGQPLEWLLPERLHAVHLAHRQRYTTAPRTRPMGAGLALVGRHKNGTEIAVDITLRPLWLDNQLLIM